MPRVEFGPIRSLMWYACHQNVTIVGAGRVRVVVSSSPTPLFECVLTEGQQMCFVWDVSRSTLNDVLYANDILIYDGRGVRGKTWVEYGRDVGDMGGDQVAMLEEKWINLK